MTQIIANTIAYVRTKIQKKKFQISMLVASNVCDRTVSPQKNK